MPLQTPRGGAAEESAWEFARSFTGSSSNQVGAREESSGLRLESCSSGDSTHLDACPSRFEPEFGDWFQPELFSCRDDNERNALDSIAGARRFSLDPSRGPSMKSLAVAGCLAVVALSGTVRGQTTLYTFLGDAANDEFGWCIDAAGDVNADGWADVVVGARYADS
ncbi:MAG: hypothetical protein IT453_01375, partial [Planctomycetes bacterium]|nr:hypothetical protein [Planctomycetota bacterium]